MIKNNSSYVKTSEDLNFILSNMYYLNNKDMDLSLEKYVKKNMLKYKCVPGARPSPGDTNK